jgi:DNA repair ATPase RecN
VVERVLRYWQRLWETDEMSLLGDALKQQSLEKGNNWLNKIKQELERMDMGDIWINGEENNRNVWREVSKRCVDIERQNMEANIRKKKVTGILKLIEE